MLIRLSARESMTDLMPNLAREWANVIHSVSTVQCRHDHQLFISSPNPWFHII